MGKLSKAKNLTKTEKFCIQGMYYNEMNLEDISKALGRDVSEVAVLCRRA
jgi:DNA-directed RNA polymerase specialized sigma subunit